MIHNMRNGFCVKCGETEEWLASTNAQMVPADRLVLPVGESFVYNGAKHVVTSHMRPGGGEEIMLAARVGVKRSRRFVLVEGAPKAI